MNSMVLRKENAKRYIKVFREYLVEDKGLNPAIISVSEILKKRNGPYIIQVRCKNADFWWYEFYSIGFFCEKDVWKYMIIYINTSPTDIKDGMGIYNV